MVYQGLDHSVLVQRDISSPSMADREFAAVYDDNEIPIVLVPRSQLCVNVATTIPSGPYVLWQQWHRDMGELKPGVIWVWPAWNRISHIVTRSTITYNAPAKDCPTADNSKSQWCQR